MLNWHNINTVFLDMDGTLLDLNFDNHFWQEHVPLRYAEKYHIDVDAAKKVLFPRFRKVEGTMDWYCIDYWTQELGLDIALLKEEIKHLIAVHPYVVDFLKTMKQHGKRLVLVTNAHTKSLQLKMRRTQLGDHFDAIICSHDFGKPKENPEFWEQLQFREAFDPNHTLLVDDSLAVLHAAQQYGIGYLLAVLNPDTKRPAKDVGEFDAIRSFQDIMPGIGLKS
jgi:HAD superfamily hydrolase (TIGR01509 family)